MPRRGQAKVKKIKPDPIYGSVVLAKLINSIMKSGKKSVAQKQVYKALEIVKEKESIEPLQVFKQALDNIRPSMEVKTIRVGGAAYQVQKPVRGIRKESLAIRLLIEASRK